MTGIFRQPFWSYPQRRVVPTVTAPARSKPPTLLPLHVLRMREKYVRFQVSAERTEVLTAPGLPPAEVSWPWRAKLPVIVPPYKAPPKPHYLVFPEPAAAPPPAPVIVPKRPPLLIPGFVLLDRRVRTLFPTHLEIVEVLAPTIPAGIPSLFTEPLHRVKKILNRNVSSLRRDTLDQTVEEIMRFLQDLQRSVDELNMREFRSVSLDQDGLPAHGSYCAAVDGQYIRLGGPIPRTEVGNERRVRQDNITAVAITTIDASGNVVPTTITIANSISGLATVGQQLLVKIQNARTTPTIDGWHIATVTGPTTLTIEQETTATTTVSSLHLIEMVFGGLFAVAHGLGRVPQGMMVVDSRGWPPKMFVSGEGAIPAATDEVVYFQTFGSERAVVVIF